MPRSRSMSIRSRYCARICRGSTTPVSCSIRSASVDLPWSMWAMMQKFRMRPGSVAPGAFAPGSSVGGTAVRSGRLSGHDRWPVVTGRSYAPTPCRPPVTPAPRSRQRLGDGTRQPPARHPGAIGRPGVAAGARCPARARRPLVTGRTGDNRVAATGMVHGRASRYRRVPYDATAVRPDWASCPPSCAPRSRPAGRPVVRPAPPAAASPAASPRVLRHRRRGPGLRQGRLAGRPAAPGRLVRPGGRDHRRAAGRAAGAPPPLDADRGRLVRRSAWTPSTGGSRDCPGRPAELAATLAAYAEVAAALRRPPAELVALGLPRLADLARADCLVGRAGRRPGAGCRRCPPAARDRLPELVALESRLPGTPTGRRPDPR